MKCFAPIAILAAFALAACNNSPAEDAGDDPAETPSGATETAAAGADGSEDLFVAACLEASNNTPNMCECLSEKAQADLTDTGRDFLVASMLDQEDRLMSLRADMDGEEVIATSRFLVDASVECAREGRQ
ncbi:hypothetical protein V0U79_03115 [Hyphobacterium sp. HN65]|uniref:Uncharacterized protein n=1 Tax=Hyphobacterium lacteum TaxID=3116575 RepID=A0ABU7LN77_9PROT|nr:hypothetical protein [Hyphobacterium sp. HN65]MEE2525342.1 hypothetical protein [Hyphobacterium sp. HN65]